jgi:hypothetical protein
MNSTIVGLVAAIAVLSGGLGLSLTDAFDDQKPMISSTATTGLLMGHLEIEARHADGELFAYRQIDNEVVDGGEGCILKMLFASSGGLTNANTDDGRGQYNSPQGTLCVGALTGAWDVIAIGTGSVAGLDAAVHDLYTGVNTEVLGDGLQRAQATDKTWGTNGSGASPRTQIIMKNTFTATASHVINESGLFNSTSVSTGGMLAHNTFDNVNLTSDDSITVTWTFKVDN